tara:strand:- start:107 stop:430 length:324 start_codon:yes stop_codon:yes gene_type:complete
MEYFKERDLAKLSKNNKTYIGGYAINCKDYNVILDTDEIINTFNGNLVIPNMYFKVDSKTNNDYQNKNYDTNIVSESLHNRLLGMLSNNNKTKKNKNYLKKTKKNKQ